MITVICRHCGLPVEAIRWRGLGSTTCDRCATKGLVDPTNGHAVQRQRVEAELARRRAMTSVTQTPTQMFMFPDRPRESRNGVTQIINHRTERKKLKRPLKTVIKDES